VRPMRRVVFDQTPANSILFVRVQAAGVSRACVMTTNRTMYLYHVAHKNLWFSFASQGVLTMYSEGALPAVWLVSRHRIGWAIQHVSRRHNLCPSELCVVRVRVRRDWVRKSRVSGTWLCMFDIQPVRIEWIKPAVPLMTAIKTQGTSLRALGGGMYAKHRDKDDWG